MKILVDMGNTQFKWARLEAGRMTESHSFKRNKTSIKTSLNKAWKNLQNVEAVFVANVSEGKFADQLSEWTDKNWQITPQLIISESKRFGVSNAYDKPEQLGVDRWLALIAARQHARQATCVIDCGTSITVDIVTRTGQHQGGLIIPGLALMRSSLTDNTAALESTDDDQAFQTLATNTYSAMQCGTLYTVTATLERLIEDLKQSFNNNIRFLISGGDAETLLPLLGDHVTFYPDIVLKGLAYYARQLDKSNKPRKKNTDIAVEKQPNSNKETEIALP